MTYKYKEKKVEYPFMVIADYQPAYMDSPSDTRIRYYKTLPEAEEGAKKHMRFADDIKILCVIKRYRGKYVATG